MFSDNTVLPVVEEVFRVCSEQMYWNLWYRIFQFKNHITFIITIQIYNDTKCPLMTFVWNDFKEFSLNLYLLFQT